MRGQIWGPNWAKWCPTSQNQMAGYPRHTRFRVPIGASALNCLNPAIVVVCKWLGSRLMTFNTSPGTWWHQWHPRCYQGSAEPEHTVSMSKIFHRKAKYVEVRCLCGGFHKMGLPRIIIHFGRNFPNKNHLAIGVPPWLWKPPCMAIYVVELLGQPQIFDCSYPFLVISIGCCKGPKAPLDAEVIVNLVVLNILIATWWGMGTPKMDGL